MKNPEISQKVAAMYNEVSYKAYGEDYFPVVKSLGLTREEFAEFAKGKRALEAGCGGGQLTAFLAGCFGSVTAIDISIGSLKTAAEECAKRGITNVEFLEANLFDEMTIEKFKESFDFVLCYGVLHHTGSPTDGYHRLTQLLRVGGMLTVGVYSRTLLSYRIKRKIVLLFAGNDPKKRERLANRLWFGGKGSLVSIYDGYVHPQVSFHSIAQVYGWIKNNGLRFVGSWPRIELSWYIGARSGATSKNFWYRVPWFLVVELMWLIRGKPVMVSMSAKKI